MVKTNRVEEVHDDKKPKILDIDGLVKWVLPLERKEWLMRKYTLAMSRMGYLYQLASSVTWVVTTTAIVVLLPMLLKIEWELRYMEYQLPGAQAPGSYNPQAGSLQGAGGAPQY